MTPGASTAQGQGGKEVFSDSSWGGHTRTPGTGVYLGASYCSAGGFQALWEVGVRGVWDSHTRVAVLLWREQGNVAAPPGDRDQREGALPGAARGPRGFVCLELEPPLHFSASFPLSFSGT